VEKFSLELNQNDREILKAVATDLGYNTDREMIDALLRQFATEHKASVVCEKKKAKFKNIYDIPPKTSSFYQQLACSHSTTISSVIFRYIIFPHIKDYLVTKSKKTK